MKPESSNESKRPEPALIVAVGRISLCPDASRVRFFALTLLSLLQAKRAAGNLHASTHGTDGAHFSLTVWESAGAMHAFAARGPHRRAMQSIGSLAAEGSFHHWRSASVPTWREALARFREEERRAQLAVEGTAADRMAPAPPRHLAEPEQS